MKTYITLFFAWFSTLGVSAQAQTLQEWLSPNQTQIEYLIAKSIALRTLNHSVVTGYEIFKHGADRVSEFRSGELEEHRNYLNRFSKLFVHPEILTGAQASLTAVNKLEVLISELKREVDSGSYNERARNAIRAKLLSVEKNALRLKKDLGSIGLGFSDNEPSRFARYRLVSKEADSLWLLGNRLLVDMQTYQSMHPTHQPSNFFFPVN